ncbi:MAG: hypothetical protein NVSMB64_04240 [Candidatus Velthaea sp.]
MDTMKIEILYFDGCPNSDEALQRVRAALASAGVVADVRMTDIRDADDAVARRFLGSPTIQINGIDAEPEARNRSDYGYMCRTYRTADGAQGVPSLHTLTAAIRECVDRPLSVPG